MFCAVVIEVKTRVYEEAKKRYGDGGSKNILIDREFMRFYLLCVKHLEYIVSVLSRIIKVFIAYCVLDCSVTNENWIFHKHAIPAPGHYRRRYLRSKIALTRTIAISISIMI